MMRAGVLTRLVPTMLALTVLAMLPPSAARAAPPSSCAHKFVGTWAYPGGTTTVLANGTALPRCPACVPVQYWTCSGNTYTFSNPGGATWTATLSADGRQLIGPVVATRVGGARPKKR